jgi:hypothetical protein
MFKSSLCLISGVSIALTAFPVGAIAPDVDKIRSCGEYTRDKYRVEGNEITVKVGRRNSRGVFLDWTVEPYRASGYCFVNNANRTTEWVVQRGPRPETVALGPNEKYFRNIPGYGDVIVNRGQGATGDKQYFLLRPVNTGKNLKWYALRANNNDQLYDHRGKYVGFNAGTRVLFPYVCEFSPLKPNPPMTPQPR